MPTLSASPGEGNGTPLQYSCLENPMDGGAWWAAVHGVARSRTRLSNFTFTFHFHALEKEMATHSSALAWRIPGTGEPGGLLSMGSHWVGHNWSDLAAAAAAAVLPQNYWIEPGILTRFPCESCVPRDKENFRGKILTGISFFSKSGWQSRRWFRNSDLCHEWNNDHMA